MQSQRGNSAGGANPFSWHEYDHLPAVVRHVMQHAAVELGTRRARVQIGSGMDPRACAKLELAVAEAARRRLLRECWPPGHPELTQ